MKNNGFTLLELLIVLAITAILAAFSYPNYRSHIIKTRRIDGQVALLDLANRMEVYYAEHKTYQTATLATGSTSDVLYSSLSPQDWYTLKITSQTDTDYSLEATPRADQAASDLTCRSLSYNSKGVKGANGGQIMVCWN